MFRKRIAIPAFIAAGLLFCGPRVIAQAVFGAIYGTVTDQNGAAVANATVTVTDTNKGVKQTIQTNENGEYRVDRLIPDTYSVAVAAPGFAPAETPGIALTANATPRVDEVLQVAGTSTQVTVTAAPPPLQTETQQISERIDEQTIAQLPNLTRNFMQNQLLTAGTVRASFDNSQAQNPQGSYSFSINGQNFGTQSWLLDGTDNRDPVLGIIVVNPTLDSVQGMQVLTENYNAEFGGAVGGIITAETKSGSNTLHGDVFFYRHTDANEARDPFTQFQRNILTDRYLPTSVYGQFGGSVGGPIIKNRTFYFGDYQGTRQKVGNTLLVSVPTNTVRNTCLTAGSTTCDLSEYLAGGVHQVYDPVTRAPYAGNLIPTSALSSQAIKLLSELPAPNVAGAGIANNYAASGFGPDDGNQGDLRVDDQTTKMMHTFARYSYVHYALSGKNIFGVAGGAGFGPSNFAGTDKVQNQNLSSGFDLALNAKLATDFRFGMLKYAVHQEKADVGSTPASDIGIPGLNTSLDTSGNPDYLFANNTIANLGDNITANSSQICNCPLKQSETEFQVVDNWTLTLGNHALRFGGDLRYAIQLRSASDTNRTGVLTFNQTTTSSASNQAGLDLATALLGYISEFQRSVVFNDTAESMQKRFAFFGQDTWRVTPKLALNYGLRWEMTFPETVNGAGNGGYTNLTTGFVQVAGVGGIGSNGGEKMSYTNLSPRLGISYQLSPSTVLRAGGAIVYDSEGFYGTLFGTSLTANVPVVTAQINQAATSNGYVYLLANGPASVSPTVVPSNGLLPLASDISYPTIRPNTIKLPKTDQWNLSVQHQFGSATTLDLAYVGNVAERTYPGSTFGYNINQYRLPTSPADEADQLHRRPLYNKYDTNGITCCSDDLTWGGPDARSNYNALQAKVAERLNSGLDLQANYSWAKAMNYSGTYFLWDPSLTYGRNDLVRTNIFNLYGSYDLPFGNGRRFAHSANRLTNYLIGGWQLSGNSTWQAGAPFTATYAECGDDEDVDTTGVLCRPNGSAAEFPMSASSLDPSSHEVRYFTPVAPLAAEGANSGPFTRPQFGQVGTVGRNTFVGPTQFFADASLIKRFAVAERVNGEFQFQAFNVFNHPVLGNPGNTCIDCTTGVPGMITDIAFDSSMRQLQFALRFSF